MATRHPARAPWQKPAARGARHTHLSGAAKRSAKARAKRAGRPYPNLVDNMAAARATTKARRPAGSGTAKRHRAPALKNPKGGLTAAGRDHQRRTRGAHLQAGVKKSPRHMSPEQMRRWGSWALRFHGRKGTLPPLKKRDGSPTRFALSAAAWGEPVPKTVAAARRIAAKGERLLATYRRSRATAR